jgi:UDP-glucose 4-epimerase
MKVVVTGGAGFIGSHLVDRFVKDGHAVAVVDNLSSGSRDNLPEGVALQACDIRSEEASTFIKSWAPEVICHQAAQIDVRTSVSDPAYDADVNVVGLVKVVEAARQGGNLKHVLFASSGGAMYGEQDEFPASEGHPVRPESPYGLAKAVGEQYLAWYHRMYGIGYTALRYANVYGPRQNPHGEAGVVAIFCDRILKGQDLTVYGDGGQTRDYVFVGDVAEANSRALQEKLVGGFNVGTGIETDVNELARNLLDVFGKEDGRAARLKVVHAEARAGEQRRSVISSAALQEAIGFEPGTPLAEGLAQTAAYFREKSKN